jgi:AAA+ ATPase superfamily predicted ATPase
MAEGNDSKSSVEFATKLVQLGRARDKTETILQAAKESAIKRHVETLREIINAVNKLVRTIEAEKITAKENNDEIDTWIGEIERKLNEGDEKITILEQWLNETREKREYRHIAIRKRKWTLKWNLSGQDEITSSANKQIKRTDDK